MDLLMDADFSIRILRNCFGDFVIGHRLNKRIHGASCENSNVYSGVQKYLARQILHFIFQKQYLKGFYRQDRRDKKIVKHRAMIKHTNNTKFLFENLVSNNIYLARYISIQISSPFIVFVSPRHFVPSEYYIIGRLQIILRDKFKTNCEKNFI